MTMRTQLGRHPFEVGKIKGFWLVAPSPLSKQTDAAAPLLLKENHAFPRIHLAKIQSIPSLTCHAWHYIITITNCHSVVASHMAYDLTVYCVDRLLMTGCMQWQYLHKYLI